MSMLARIRDRIANCRLSTAAWDRIILRLAVLLVLSYALTGPLGRLEGQLLPVLANGAITETREDGYQTLFRGTVEKLRNCRIIEFRAYQTDEDGTRRRLPINFLERRQRRPVGPMQFGWWAAPLAPAQVTGSIVLEGWYNCHWGFPTITEFYPGRSERR